MEISDMEQRIDELKKAKRAKSAVVLKRWQETIEQLDELEDGEKQIYVNGATEELKQYCLIAKDKVKVKIKGE